MRDEELVARYPRIYDLAYGPEMWTSIKRHGLLSVAALLERWEIPPARRAQLLREHRANEVALTHPLYGAAYLRDQHPLNVKMLERVLTDMTVPDWLEQLNSHVFFSATMERLEKLYSAYRDRTRLVLTVDTASLLGAHRGRIRLSPINTGAVRSVSHLRGSATLARISSFDRREVAELAVYRAVGDVTEHVCRTEVWHPSGGRELMPDG